MKHIWTDGHNHPSVFISCIVCKEHIQVLKYINTSNIYFCIFYCSLRYWPKNMAYLMYLFALFVYSVCYNFDFLFRRIHTCTCMYTHIVCVCVCEQNSAFISKFWQPGEYLLTCDILFFIGSERVRNMYLHMRIDFSSPSNELLDHVHVTTLTGHKQWSSTILEANRVIRNKSHGTIWKQSCKANVWTCERWNRWGMEIVSWLIFFSWYC